MHLTMRQHEQQCEADGESGVTDRKHVAPFIAIGSMAGKWKEKNCRKKLGEADEAEIERPVGDLIDLPTDGHGLHLDGGHDQKACDLEQHKRRMRKGGASSSGVGGHALLM